MTRRKQQDAPDYVLQYLHKRVRWFDGKLFRKGIVLEVDRFYLDKRAHTRLRVLRDDGFLSVGVDVDLVLEVEGYDPARRGEEARPK